MNDQFKVLLKAAEAKAKARPKYEDGLVHQKNLVAQSIEDASDGGLVACVARIPTLYSKDVEEFLKVNGYSVSNIVRESNENFTFLSISWEFA